MIDLLKFFVIIIAALTGIGWSLEASAQGVFCYYLVNPKDDNEVLILRDPPWNLQQDQANLTAEELETRQLLGHLIIGLTEGDCEGLSRSEFKKKVRAIRQKHAQEATATASQPSQPEPPQPPPEPPQPPPQPPGNASEPTLPAMPHEHSAGGDFM